jgi:thiol-disulfide isomerase/thioredoxin
MLNAITLNNNMKIFNIFFVFLGIHSYIYAENEIIITGKFIASEAIKIKIYEPINGYFNVAQYPTIDNCIIDNSDSFYYKTQTNGPITLLVYITTLKNLFVEKSIIIAFPNDSIHITMLLEDVNKNSLHYSGSNAQGQKLMNDIEYDPVSKYLPIFEILDRLKENKTKLISETNEIVNFTTKRFDSLLQIKMITNEFNECYKVMFTQQLYELIISKFLYNYKQREVFTKYERDSIISYFFSKQPVSNPYCKTTFNSNLYLKAYYNYISYKKLGLSSIEPLMENKVYEIKGKSIKIQNFCGQYTYMDDKNMQEDLWAIDMLMSIDFGSPTPIKETINQFNDIFPNSKWKIFLEKQYLNKNSNVNFEYFLSMPVNYIDSLKNIKTLKGLFNELPYNKPIFVDIWASWCGPCALSFQFNKDLDSFLIANNIEHLYISLDNVGSDKKWIASINTYKLGGYHIIANEFLINEIKNIYKLEKNNGIEIPKYILVNKEKNIVLKNATSPIDLDTLKKEMLTCLLK